MLAKSRDEAANAVVGVGRRLLQRIFGKRQAGEPVPKVLADVIEHPDDVDYLGTLRVAMREALTADAELAEQIEAIVRDARAAGIQVTASVSVRSLRTPIRDHRDRGRQHHPAVML